MVLRLLYFTGSPASQRSKLQGGISTHYADEKGMKANCSGFMGWVIIFVGRKRKVRLLSQHGSVRQSFWAIRSNPDTNITDPASDVSQSSHSLFVPLASHPRESVVH